MILDRLQTLCEKGPISYRDYIDLVLYDKDCGYYKRARERIGRSPDHDFYTAESLGPVFAQLVTTAAFDLLGSTVAEKSTFVEIAAEPDKGLLQYLQVSPFANSRMIQQGDPINIDGPVVIFANEWLDALPFNRLIFSKGSWRERGIYTDKDNSLKEVLLDSLTTEVSAVSERLPEQAPEGYQIDLPLETEKKLADLLAQDWTGLLLLFDYGKSWQALRNECPFGTARTYYCHKQATDLLDQPGSKDITCDICWDPLIDMLNEKNFQSVTLETQEFFFVQRAQRAAESIINESPGMFNPARQTLMELIHPGNMGRRFQVLWGLRN